MKYTLALTLLIAAAAQDDTDSQDNTQSQSQSQQSDDQSYGSTQSYGGEVESYAAPAVAVEAFRPKVCVSLCPVEAPFFNVHSGACTPGVCRREVPAYASWGEQSGGYRRLEESDNAYGYQAPAQEQSYAAPVESYAEPAEPLCDLQQPRGTIDTRNNRIDRSGMIALWIGFGCLFLSSVYFINRYLWFYYLADAADGSVDWRIGSNSGSGIFAFLASPSLICGMVTFIASLAYLAMATHHGFYTRCFDGREFYYARYLDWVITTPMMLHALAYIGNMEDNIWHYLFFNDILMIISGLIGSTVGGSEKWVFFGFSILTFIPVIYYLCERKNRTIDNRIFDGAGAVVASLSAGIEGGSFLPHVHFIVGYKNIMWLTVTAWSLYPVVWILAEGTDTISANGEAIFYTILDIISKAGFGMFIVGMKRNSFNQAIAAGIKVLEPDSDWTEAMLAGAVVVGGIANSGSSAL